MANQIPRFSALPLNMNDPPLSAWGLYGKDDQLGTLNRLTDDVVLEAAKEIKTGVRMSLNWPLDGQGDIPFFGRQLFEKKIIHKAPRTVNDDIWSFNSQGSSQWDGLRHYGYQNEKKFYNGVTIEDIHGADKTDVNGIHVWSEKGIVGRGVLIDYHSWAQTQGIKKDVFQTNKISLNDLKQVLVSQGTELKFGDILIIRSGYMARYKSMSKDDLIALSKVNPPPLIGVEPSDEMLQWIWENFSAVAGDHPSFECWPKQREPSLHEVLLGGWGCPIGELFDLERVAEHCKTANRWSFFLTSEVCNVPGGVASPPNALAIF